MRTISKIAVTSASGIALAAGLASPAYAWHPQGKIVKSVQNVSANGAMQDANGAGNAVSAKPGDILAYSITISNPAAPADNHDNDLASVQLQDSLPQGIELTGTPAQREIVETIGTILPGKSVTKTYRVKVTATTDGTVIENKACFTGNSVVNDSPQQGCDVADVKVSVPVTPVTPPAPTPTPVAGKGAVAPAPVQTPASLPDTGPSNVIGISALVFALGYAASALHLRRRAARA